MAHDSHRCTLTIKPIADQGAWMLYSADLSGPGSFNFNLQFRVPASLAHLVSERADPFVLASLFHCQYQNLALRV